MLHRAIDRSHKPLVLVVEDADRTGPDGQIFLETLNNYMSQKPIADLVPIVVIAPQTRIAFDRRANEIQGIETSLKIYDEKIYFRAKLDDDSIRKFYENGGINSDIAEPIIKATQLIVSQPRSVITIRLLKHALRETVQYLSLRPEANPTIVLTFILSRYVEVSDSLGSSRVAASNKIIDGNEYGTESVRHFFKALLAGLNKMEDAEGVSTYKLEFVPDDTELLGSVFTHPVGRTRYDFTLPNYYLDLVRW